MKKLLLSLFLFALIINYSDAQCDGTVEDLPCEFGWDNIVLPDGTSMNFTEDKGCQPYQGPCLAFSLIKAMETKLNWASRNQCKKARGADFSIPYLYVFGVTFSGHFAQLNNGAGIPGGGCGEFPPECEQETLGQTNNYCSCLVGTIADLATDPETSIQLCFEDIELTITINDESNGNGQGPSITECSEAWEVETSIPTADRIYTEGVEWYTPSSIEELKTKIMQNGPIPAVFDIIIANDLRPYGVTTDDADYHAFNFIGWEMSPEGATIWRIDDHFPNQGWDVGPFCGIGVTKLLDNTTLMDYIDSGNLSFIDIGRVSTDHTCYDRHTSVSFFFDCEDQCRCATVPPVVTDIELLGSNQCLISDFTNPMKAVVDCGTDSEDYEYEWVVLPGGTGTPFVGPCLSTCDVIPGPIVQSVTVKVRVRESELCPWSDWHTEQFCATGGGGN